MSIATDNSALLLAINRRGLALKNPPRVCVVYALYDPVTDLPCYIGATSNWKGRRSSHLTATKKTSLKVQEWCDQLQKAGFKPAFVILRETTAELMAEHEAEEIKRWSRKTKLLNVVLPA